MNHLDRPLRRAAPGPLVPQSLMKELDRLRRNEEKLAELYPAFAVRIRRVIEALESAGIRHRIQEAYRPLAEQLRAYRSGRSQVRFGFHNVTGAEGEKEALAVDLLDDDAPLSPSTSYLLRLAAEARAQDLRTGLPWGLPARQRQTVEKAVAERNFAARIRPGWDPTHVEPAGLTPAEAHSGKRPVWKG